MAVFCTQCGAGIPDGVVFCTQCGHSMGSAPENAATVTETPTASAPRGDRLKTLTKSPLLRVASVLVVIGGVGAGSYSAGKSSIDKEKIRTESFNQGLEEGDSKGYQRGYSAGENAGKSNGYDSGYDTGYDTGYDAGESSGRSSGYSEGLNDGCEKVFEFSDGTFDHVIPYNPYGYGSGRYPGDYYTSLSDC